VPTQTTLLLDAALANGFPLKKPGEHGTGCPPIPPEFHSFQKAELQPRILFTCLPKGPEG